MRSIRRILVSAIVALAMLPVCGATAQTAQEEERVRAVLAQLRAGEKIKVATTQRNLGSTEIVAADIAVARAMAKACSLGEYSIVKTITNKPGLSVIAVNLDCTERKHYGFLFSFQEGDLTGVELRPEGILFAPPPPPASSPPPSPGWNSKAEAKKGFDDPRDYYRRAKHILDSAIAGDDREVSSLIWPDSKIKFDEDASARFSTLNLDAANIRLLLNDCKREGQIEVDNTGATMSFVCSNKKLQGRYEITFEYYGQKVMIAFISKLKDEAGDASMKAGANG